MVSTLLIRRLSNRLVNQHPTSSHFWRGVAPANLTRTMNPIRSRYGTSLTGRTIQSASASGQIIFEFEEAIDEAIGESKAVARMVVVFVGELPTALRARPMTGHGWGRAIFWTPGRARAWPLLLTRWRRLAGVRASSMKRNNSRRCVGFNARYASSAPRVLSSSRRISGGTLT